MRPFGPKRSQENLRAPIEIPFLPKSILGLLDAGVAHPELHWDPPVPTTDFLTLPEVHQQLFGLDTLFGAVQADEGIALDWKLGEALCQLLFLLGTLSRTRLVVRGSAVVEVHILVSALGHIDVLGHAAGSCSQLGEGVPRLLPVATINVNWRLSAAVGRPALPSTVKSALVLETLLIGEDSVEGRTSLRTLAPNRTR